MTDLSAFQHPRFARMYEHISIESERRGTAEHRDRTLGGLSGRVIEVGAGNGLNFAHYPTTVTEVVAIEPDDTLRGLAERAAVDAPVSVKVIAAHADELPFNNETFDAAVASLVLCSVPDPHSAVTELHRVLKSGAQLRFFEHVRSANPVRGAIQDALTPIWSRIGGGCHLNRDTVATITAAGFTIESVDEDVYAPLRFIPAFRHTIGQARRC